MTNNTLLQLIKNNNWIPLHVQNPLNLNGNSLNRSDEKFWYISMFVCLLACFLGAMLVLEALCSQAQPLITC